MDAPLIKYKLLLNGLDATKDLTPYVLSITYSDNMGEKSDEVEVTLDNTDQRFLNAWYITTNMTLELYIGEMYAGKFSIDVSTQSAPSHTATIRGQSSLYLRYLKQKRSKSHHKKKLSNILQQYAQEHGFRIVGTPPDLTFTTHIQSKKTDLQYLHELAQTYGCIFALKGDTMIFDTIENIWKREAAKTIRLTDQMSYSFTSSIERNPDASMSIYTDPLTGQKVGAVVYKQGHDSNTTPIGNSGGLEVKTVSSPQFDDDYKCTSRMAMVHVKKAESVQEAQRIATGSVLNGIRKNFTGTVTIPGDELIVAGQTINIEGVGKRSGKYLVESSKHILSKDGAYQTVITISQISQGGVKTPPKQKVEPHINQNSARYLDDASGSRIITGVGRRV